MPRKSTLPTLTPYSGGVRYYPHPPLLFLLRRPHPPSPFILPPPAPSFGYIVPSSSTSTSTSFPISHRRRPLLPRHRHPSCRSSKLPPPFPPLLFFLYPADSPSITATLFTFSFLFLTRRLSETERQSSRKRKIEEVELVDRYALVSSRPPCSFSSPSLPPTFLHSFFLSFIPSLFIYISSDHLIHSRDISVNAKNLRRARKGGDYNAFVPPRGNFVGETRPLKRLRASTIVPMQYDLLLSSSTKT